MSKLMLRYLGLCQARIYFETLGGGWGHLNQQPQTKTQKPETQNKNKNINQKPETNNKKQNKNKTRNPKP